MTLKEKINYMLSQYSMTNDNPTVLRELKRLAALTEQVVGWVEDNDLTDFSGQIANVNARMDEIEGLVRSLNLGTINSDIAALKIAVAQAQDNANAAKAAAESAETASANAVSDVAELGTTVNDFRGSINESIRTLTASVSAADTKADAAASKANDAVSAAEEANTTAEAASTKADTANTTASQAKTTADAAKTAADKAATDVQEMQFKLDGKQDVLTFDSTPTAGSGNPVTSDGIYKAIQAGGGETIVLDDTVTENSHNGVKSSGIYTAIESAKTTLGQRITNVDTKVDAHTDDISALQEFQQTQDMANETHNTQIAANASAIGSLQTGKQDRLKKVAGETTQYAQTTLANTVPDSVSPTDPVTIPTTEAVSAALSKKQGTLTFDSAPENGSENPVTSGGIFTALEGKQDSLTFDSTPTEGSGNPVTSDGIYKAIQAGGGETIVLDNTVTKDSQNGVKSSGIYTAIKAVQDDLDGQKTLISANTVAIDTAEGKITALEENSKTVATELSTLSGEVATLEADKMNKMNVDKQPTNNSTNLVESGGVYTEIARVSNTAAEALTTAANKQDALKFDTKPKSGSANPVTSGGLFDKFNTVQNDINSKMSKLTTTEGSMVNDISDRVLPELVSEPANNTSLATALAVWNAIQAASGAASGGGRLSVIRTSWVYDGHLKYKPTENIPETFTPIFMILCGKMDNDNVSFMIPIVPTKSITDYADMGTYICNHPSRSDIDLIMPVVDTMKVAYYRNSINPLYIKQSSLTYARFSSNGIVSGSERPIKLVDRDSYIFGIES